MKYIPFLLVVVAFAGCASRARMIPDDPIRRAAILESLREREAAIQGVRGMVSVRFGSGLFKGLANLALVAQKPEKVRLDVLTEAGIEAWQGVIESKKLTIYWPGRQEYLQVPADQEHLEQELKIALTPKALVQALLSTPSIQEGVNLKKVKNKESKKEEWLLEGPTGGWRFEEKDDEYVPLGYTAFDSSGRRVYTVSFRGYQQKNSVWFPSHLEVVWYKSKMKLEAHYEDWEINPVFRKNIFSLTIPKDAIPVR